MKTLKLLIQKEGDPEPRPSEMYYLDLWLIQQPDGSLYVRKARKLSIQPGSLYQKVENQ